MKTNNLQILGESDGDNMMECHKWGEKSGYNNVALTLSGIENIDGYQIIVRVFQWHVTLMLHRNRVTFSSIFFL